jgi:GTPase SAR1 family protein
MLDSWIAYADGFILVYAIDDRESYDVIKSRYDRIVKTKKIEKPSIIMVGNKCDLVDNRKIGKEEAEELTKMLGVSFMEVSALEKINVKECFLGIAQELLHNSLSLHTNNNEKTKKRCYCF